MPKEMMEKEMEVPEMESPEMEGAEEYSGGGEVAVPVSALAQPDNDEQMQTPEAGDTATVQVEIKVSRIEGETAYVIPTSINGTPLKQGAHESGETPEKENLEEELVKQVNANGGRFPE